ncbi:MAG: ferritin [Candidatus Gastranaerophilaceae bacterium]|nr:ferroxidase [Clostridium sp. CAG:967]
MINKKVEDILNAQINKEFYSAYLYLAMSAFFDEIGLYGFANWTKVQAREEVDHGMILFDYIIERDGTIDLQQINSPDRAFENPLQVFEKILDHERYVTESINCVASLSDDECDLATRHFINWYISEQVEEEANALDIIKKLKMFGEDKSSLYQLDKDLGARTYQQHTYNLNS